MQAYKLIVLSLVLVLSACHSMGDFSQKDVKTDIAAGLEGGACLSADPKCTNGLVCEATQNICVKQSSYSLKVTVIGSGTVTSAPAGINCPTTCSAVFDTGATVVLSVEADTANGWKFSGWDHGTTAAQESVTIDGDTNVSAFFSDSWYYFVGSDVASYNYVGQKSDDTRAYFGIGNISTDHVAKVLLSTFSGNSAINVDYVAADDKNFQVSNVKKMADGTIFVLGSSMYKNHFNADVVDYGKLGFVAINGSSAKEYVFDEQEAIYSGPPKVTPLHTSLTDVVAVSDGYLLVGNTSAFSANQSYDENVSIIKLDKSFNIIKNVVHGALAKFDASKKLVQGGDDFANFIKQNANGDYVVIGSTRSFYPSGSGNDIFMMTIGSDSIARWQLYRGVGFSDITSVKEHGGNYIILGYFNSNYFVVDLNSAGDINCQYAPAISESGASLALTSDGGFVVAGSVDSSDSQTLAVTKFSPGGTPLWEKMFKLANTKGSYATSISEADDHGLLISGLILDDPSTGSIMGSYVMKLYADGTLNDSCSQFTVSSVTTSRGKDPFSKISEIKQTPQIAGGSDYHVYQIAADLQPAAISLDVSDQCAEINAIMGLVAKTDTGIKNNLLNGVHILGAATNINTEAQGAESVNIIYKGPLTDKVAHPDMRIDAKYDKNIGGHSPVIDPVDMRELSPDTSPKEQLKEQGAAAVQH